MRKGKSCFEIPTLPTTPGVYRIFNPGGELIYVGKAKNLRRRLGQYRNAKRRKKHQKMRLIVAEAARIETTDCVSDLDACLLEAKLIQELRPKWNTAGAFHFMYPMIGIRSRGDGIDFCFTTQPEAFSEFSFHGAYRSRWITGGGFFALMKLLQYIGHRSKSKARSLIKYSYVYSFRNLPESWPMLLDSFFRGESKEFLEHLVMELIENRGARARSKDTQKQLNTLARFWRFECKAVANACVLMAYGTYPIPQKERDILFLKYRFAKIEKAASKVKSPRRVQAQV